jgi:hypothetical protein
MFDVLEAQKRRPAMKERLALCRSWAPVSPLRTFCYPENYKNHDRKGSDDMTRRVLLASTFLPLLPILVFAQTDKQIHRKDSVTVSTGISKEQLALEDQLNGVVAQGDQFLRGGSAADAIKQYQTALDMVQKQPLLVEREPLGSKETRW